MAAMPTAPTTPWYVRRPGTQVQTYIRVGKIKALSLAEWMERDEKQARQNRDNETCRPDMLKAEPSDVKQKTPLDKSRDSKHPSRVRSEDGDAIEQETESPLKRMNHSMALSDKYIAESHMRLIQYEKTLEDIIRRRKIRPKSAEDQAKCDWLLTAENKYRAAIACLRENVEEKLYTEKIRQFWYVVKRGPSLVLIAYSHQHRLCRCLREIYVQLSPDERNSTEFKNLYIRFFQLSDSVAEVDSGRACPVCKSVLKIDKTKAMYVCVAVRKPCKKWNSSNCCRCLRWQCERCGLSMPALVFKTNVRIMLAKPTQGAASPENKKWNAFITSLLRHKQGECPVTDLELWDIGRWIDTYKPVYDFTLV